VIALSHAELGRRLFYAGGSPQLLFTENETNAERLFQSHSRTPYVKDGINNYVVQGQREAVNPALKGTKASAHYVITVPAGGSQVIRVRLTDTPLTGSPAEARVTELGGDFDTTLATRKQEADEFYRGVIPATLNADQANVMRQALAGMLWSKQF